MIYSAQDVVNYVLGYYAYEKHVHISNLKLQKILYFLQATFMVSRNEPLFYEEITAVDFGPIVPDIYRKYAVYGCGPIFYEYKDRNRDYLIHIKNCNKKEINDLLDELETYSSTSLLTIIHNQDPWYNGYHKNCSRIITKNSLREFFA